ncbi:hypothetical protein C6P46_007057 [Rhodotorula mucilaginosa]|uniref:Uncharacterized protein n=1 Tax=Rhodotorula mucilaginosa TaxID=5537 RepID=A0A9P7B3P9_RHOMI|nr:hypothetical protein C6P46_007057 [Rhodotorula mucilaginosa]
MYRPDYDTLMERLTNQSTVRKPWTKSPVGKHPTPRTTSTTAPLEPAKPPQPRHSAPHEFDTLWGLMLSIQDTTPTSLVHRTQLRDFLFQARNKPMPRPSYHVLVQRLTNQTEVPNMVSLMAKPRTFELACNTARSPPPESSATAGSASKTTPAAEPCAAAYTAEASSAPPENNDDAGRWQDLIDWHQSEHPQPQHSLGFRPALGYPAARIYGSSLSFLAHCARSSSAVPFENWPKLSFRDASE